MRTFILVALLAAILGMLYTATSYRASTERIAKLQADWNQLELRESNGCHCTVCKRICQDSAPQKKKRGGQPLDTILIALADDAITGVIVSIPAGAMHVR